MKTDSGILTFLRPAKVVDLFRTYFGPTKTAFDRLDPAKQQAL